jgi:hypothetical protein
VCQRVHVALCYYNSRNSRKHACCEQTSFGNVRVHCAVFSKLALRATRNNGNSLTKAWFLHWRYTQTGGYNPFASGAQQQPTVSPFARSSLDLRTPCLIVQGAPAGTEVSMKRSKVKRSYVKRLALYYCS